MDGDPAGNTILFDLLLLLFFTLMNAYFAGAEMAVVSVNKNRIRSLAEEGNKKAKVIEGLFDDSTKFLSTIQVAITFAGFYSSASAAAGLSPVLADIRSDRFSFFEGETVRLESYVYNDLEQQQVTVKYQAELLTENRGEILSDAENQDFVVNVIGSGEKELSVPACSSEFAGFVTFEIPKLAGFLKEKEESEAAGGKACFCRKRQHFY